jgi:hypothetical protein
LDVRCKITVLKVLLVLAASQLTSRHTWQAALCMLICGWAFWMNFRQVNRQSFVFFCVSRGQLQCDGWVGLLD